MLSLPFYCSIVGCSERDLSRYSDHSTSCPQGNRIQNSVISEDCIGNPHSNGSPIEALGGDVIVFSKGVRTILMRLPWFCPLAVLNMLMCRSTLRAFDLLQNKPWAI